MNLTRFEIEDFMNVYRAFKDDPIEFHPTFRLKPMMMLCEDWLEQQSIITAQQKAIAMSRGIMLGSGTVLLGMAVLETVKLVRKKNRVEVETQTLDPHPLDTELREGSWVMDFNDKKGAR